MQIVQRIATPEGWDRMNEWLRTAERAKNNDRLRTLLTQCLEANVTIELLEKSRTDADTSMPKFIQQLSKKSKDVGVMKLAAEIVSKWKKVIKASEGEARKAGPNKITPTPPASKQPTKQHAQAEPSILDKVQEQMDTDILSKNLLATTSTAGSAAVTPQQKPIRTTTVKAKISNPRLTGIRRKPPVQSECSPTD